VDLLEHLLDGGYLPVLSPVSRDASSDTGIGALNVNGDDAASALAVALGAHELLLVSDVEGVSRDGELLPTLTPACVEELVRQHVATGGMRAKLEAGCAALAGGVARVRISDVAAISDPARGTILSHPGDLS